MTTYFERWKIWTGWLGWRSRRAWVAGFTLLCALVLLVALTSPCWSTIAFVMSPERLHYSVQAEFQELPADDRELEAWLQAHAKFYSEVRRNGQTISVGWGAAGYEWEPIRPNLRHEFERFGYKGMVSYQEKKRVVDF